MNIKKPLLVLGAATGIGLAGVTGIGVASATTSKTGGTDTIIDKIATRFNLKKEDVAAVFDEERAAHKAERQQQVEERLTQAVQDGKLTEEQKAKVLAKLEELKVKREAWKGKTPEERRQAKQDLRQELKQWAKDNNIPLSYLMPMHGRHSV